MLDEPTNHLDLWARDALERSLVEFEGTVLFVSHDRYFVNQVADHLLVVEPGRVRRGRGQLHRLSAPARSGLASAGGRAGPPPSAGRRKPPRTARNGRRQRNRRAAGARFPYRKLEDLEREIFDREARLEELHALLADPETLRDGDRVRQTKAGIADQQEKLETLYAHWEEAAERAKEK